jgi:enoyl-CoA hydratase/carnithine racemase
MAEEVLYSVADGVATITLNRPERLNALNGAMYHGLTEAFDQTDRDDQVRVVIVTGAAALSAPAPT